MKNPDIFKTYDIRGRVDTGEITPAIMEDIGIVFADQVEADGVAVGRDCRSSSPQLQEAFMAGVIGAGKDVLDVGEVTTDMVYYASAVNRIVAAMITASHNPPYHNGVKLCRSAARHFSGQDLENIRDKLPLAKTKPVSQHGSYTQADVLVDYVEHLGNIFADGEQPTNLRVGIDCGNGTAGPLVEAVIEKLPIEVIGIYMEPDGDFPNHPANPSDKKNLCDLAKLVQAENLDLGVAFDTDADRAVFVDNLGQPMDGNSGVSLIARWCLARQPGEHIVYDSIASQIVRQTIQKHGGQPVRSRVGFPFIKEEMLGSDAFFGGETSGHYYFRDNFSIDSGALAMLAMLRVVSEADRPLSVLRSEFEVYVSSGEVTFKIADRPAAIERVAASFNGEAEVDYLDGLTITWPQKWLNLRSSNTEPIIRLNVEGVDQNEVSELVARICGIIDQ